MMWAIVETVGAILIIVSMVFMGIYLNLVLINGIKLMLVDLEWIHPKYDECDDDDDDDEDDG